MNVIIQFAGKALGASALILAIGMTLWWGWGADGRVAAHGELGAPTVTPSVVAMPTSTAIDIQLITYPDDCKQELAIFNFWAIEPEDDEFRALDIFIHPTGDRNDFGHWIFQNEFPSITSGGGWGEGTLALEVGADQRYVLDSLSMDIEALWRLVFYKEGESSDFHTWEEIGEIQLRLIPDASLVDGGYWALSSCVHANWPSREHTVAIAAKDSEIARLGDALAMSNADMDRMRDARDAAIAAKEALAETLRSRSEAYQARIDQLREANRRLQERVNDLRARLRAR